MGPLSGVKVLDLSRVLAGPWATQALADFGASVFKIEKPGAGDDTRGWGPPWLADRDGHATGQAAYYLSCNRGKQSVAIDLASADGQSLVRRLAQRADVLVENFKVGGLARYGLSFPDLAPSCPHLIYCSITAYGQDGPAAQGAGYDLAIQGMSGLMGITGVADGEPGAGPQRVGVAIADLLTGVYAIGAITAALYEREKSGLGQYIDLALLDAMVGTLANQNLNYLLTGRPPVRQGNSHPNIVPYQVFGTEDGHFLLAVGNDRQFAQFCAVAGRPDLAEDARYRRNSDRVAHRDALVPELARLCQTRTTLDWLTSLTARGVPCGPINDLAAVYADPQIRHRKLAFTLPHPESGEVPQVRNPVLYSRTQLEYQIPPPLLGQHTDQVLSAELGLTASELAGLRARGVIG
jgi:crotonobetainyl-CoA:carnitine CoA-transferase CaiB-like acyl-CoA transferase